MHGLRRAGIAFLLAMLASFGPLCTDMYLPALPDIAGDLSISTALCQGSITSCLLGLALGQIFIGPVSDGKGRRGILLIALSLFVISSLCCSQVTSGPAFIALRLAQGLGGAGGAVLSRAISCDTYQGPSLTQFMAILMAIHGIAPILGPILGGFLSSSWGWRSVFYLLTALGIVLTLCVFFFLPETLVREKRIQGGIPASLRNMAGLFHQKAFLCYTGVQGFTMGGFFCYVSASPFIFQKMYALSVGQFSLIFACNAMGITLLSLLTGLLSKRFGDRRLLAVGDVLRFLSCLALLAVAIIQPVSPLPMLGAMFAMLSTQGITMTTSFTLAITSQTTGAGAASGILGVAVFIFGAFTSPLAGLAGPESALPLGIVCTLTGFVSLCLSLIGNRAFENCQARSNAHSILGKTPRS